MDDQSLFSMLVLRMTDDSKFDFLWELNNARAAIAAGRFESGEFKGGGFKWTAAIQKRGDNGAVYFTLRCDDDQNRNWKCEGEVGLHWLKSNRRLLFCGKHSFRFDENNTVLELNNSTGEHTLVRWGTLDIQRLIHKPAFELRINIISSTRGQSIAPPGKFAAPNNMSNVVLVIGEKKIHVSKEFLAVHSPVFEALFFGNFDEKGKDEVEIKDVIYEEFIDLLHVIYPGGCTVADSTVRHILALGGRFQMKFVLDLAESFLRSSKRFTTVEKMRLSDQYRLAELRDDCLKSFSNAREISKIESTPEYADFSDGMKAAICDRVLKLLKSSN